MIKQLILLTIFIVCSLEAQEINSVVAESANDICPIKIGSEIPDVVLYTLEGKEVNLPELVKEQKSILIFYRGGWCPYCNLHLSELQKIEAQLVEIGYKIIAISVDEPEALSATMEKHNLKYELYSDKNADVCKAFGLAFDSGAKHHVLPVPAVFLVDENAKIKFEYVNPNYKERMSGQLLFEVAKLY